MKICLSSGSTKWNLKVCLWRMKISWSLIILVPQYYSFSVDLITPNIYHKEKWHPSAEHTQFGFVINYLWFFARQPSENTFLYSIYINQAVSKNLSCFDFLTVFTVQFVLYNILVEFYYEKIFYSWMSLEKQNSRNMIKWNFNNYYDIHVGSGIKV